MPTSLGPRLAAAVFLLAGAALPARAQARDSAAFVTLYGPDTVAVERWVREGDRWEVAVLERSPVAMLRRYALELDRRGRIQRFEERWHDAGDPAGAPTRTLVLEAAPRGWMGRITQYGNTREGMVPGDPAALPYRYREHWPLELAMARVRPGSTRTLPMLENLQVIPVTLERGRGEVRVVQERRAPYVARVDEAGRVQAVDIPLVPRDLVVTRVPWMEIDERARRWQATQFRRVPAGELSGVASAGGTYEMSGTAGPRPEAAPALKREAAAVGEARIVVEYATVSLRGRQAWGGVVPWGQVWATGARLTTTRELLLGESLRVPAGEYTLHSVHEPGGGALIVRRGTEDVGRVPTRRVQRVFTDDDFSIEVDPGVIRLIWGDSEYVVPFTVR